MRSSVKRSALVLAMALCVAAPGLALTNIATGVTGGIGIAADPGGNTVYYVDWNGGTLKRITLSPPDCIAPACAVTTIASGLSHPQDVALDTANNVAYVTTRDDAGTTGKLWRIELTAPFAKTLVTFNFGAPHQIALDAATDTAYTVGYDSGILWKVQLSTGIKKKIFTGLQKPIGLAVTADRTRAYVTEETPGRINEIEIATAKSLRTIAIGATPFYLTWADPTESSLYVVRRGTKDIQRVDLPTSATVTALSGLPALPSGVAVHPFGGAIYVAADNVVVRENLGTLPATEPVFLGVGNIPSSSIDLVDGYATTPAGYFMQVKDAPFGGTLNIFGNFTTFAAIGTHYRVMVRRNGGPEAPLVQSWTMARWDPVSSMYKSFTVIPDSDGRYAIPPEYPSTPHRLLPAFLMMRWPTSLNGLYELRVEVYQQSGASFVDKTFMIPTGNKLTLRVDNDPPVVALNGIYQLGLPNPVGTCAIVSAPPSTFQLQITAHDPNGHLLSYSAVAYWGNNKSGTVIPGVGYSAQDGPRTWFGVTNLKAPAAGWAAQCNCAHSFFVHASKRTTDGYSYVYYSSAHRSITIMNTGTTCAP